MLFTIGGFARITQALRINKVVIKGALERTSEGLLLRCQTKYIFGPSISRINARCCVLELKRSVMDQGRESQKDTQYQYSQLPPN